MLKHKAQDIVVITLLASLSLSLVLSLLHIIMYVLCSNIIIDAL